MDSQESQGNQEVPSTPLFAFHIRSSQDFSAVPSFPTSSMNPSIVNIRQMRNTTIDQGVPWTPSSDPISSSSATNEPLSQAEQQVPITPRSFTKMETVSRPGSNMGTLHCPKFSQSRSKSLRAIEQTKRIAHISTWKGTLNIFQDDDIFD